MSPLNSDLCKTLTLTEVPAATETSFQSTLEAAVRAGVHISDDTPPDHEWFDGQDCKLHFIDWGGEGKPVLVFIHGFLQQARTWDFTCLDLREWFRCVSLDLRGHGESGKPEKPDYTTHHYLDDLKRLVEHLRVSRGITEFGLCGLSLGGQLSYLYASEHLDDVRCITVVDVAPELNREARKGVRRYISSLPNDGSFGDLVSRVAELSPMRTHDQVRASLLRAVSTHDDGSWSWKHDPRLLDTHRTSYTSNELWSALSAVRKPTLFVLGRNSRMVSPETVRRMVESVPGSYASYVPNASHRVPGDNPLGFLKSVKPFLQRHLAEDFAEAWSR